MGKTDIEWTAGDDGSKGATWNPFRGCARVSAGCENCYAETMAGRFSGPDMPFANVIRQTEKGRAVWNGRVFVVEGHLADPIAWTKPRRIFVNSMSDTFYEKLSNEAVAAVFGVMALAPQHTFMLLTKRAKRMHDWFTWVSSQDKPAPYVCAEALKRFGIVRFGPVEWPLSHVWLGVSVENEDTAPRISWLTKTPAKTRFISYEPALGPVNFEPHFATKAIHWCLVGGESTHEGRPFDLAWARAAIAQCRQYGVAPFIKQLGAHPIENGTPYKLRAHALKGNLPEEWPKDLRVREFPL
jgi:protein gp37